MQKEPKTADDKIRALPAKYRGNTPVIRNLRDYEEAMNRRVVGE